MNKIVGLSLCLLLLLLPQTVFAAKKVPILVYHSIDEYRGHGSKELYVTPANFEEQMKYLRDHGFTLLTFEHWNELLHVKKPIFLTFDDGYKNNLHVFSTFQKLQTQSFKPTGTFFIISDFIGKSNRLSASDLRKMADSDLISIQSHTATHPDLTKITDFAYELEGSKDKIHSITGKPVIALSYPYGSYDAKVVDETKKYYQFAVTTIPELFSHRNLRDESYLIPRIYIKYSTSIEEFAEIVEGKNVR
ncbi:MAG: polysaccharide deacetylase family protein [Heyndrickxia sp.]